MLRRVEKILNVVVHSYRFVGALFQTGLANPFFGFLRLRRGEGGAGEGRTSRDGERERGLMALGYICRMTTSFRTG